MEMESIKKLKVTVEKCLEELSKKSDLNPAETKAALDGMELRELLQCELDNCKAKDDAEKFDKGYSGHDRPYREYYITSYGRPVQVAYPDWNSMSMRSMPRVRGYSGDYGVEGWYRSNSDGMMHDGRSYDGRSYESDMDRSERRRGYSRHSIGDRVVEKLERMMDNTESNYEREELHKFIRMVRSAAD